MSTPCENCGSDLRVCVDCDLYNGKYIEIPDNATNGDVMNTMFDIVEDKHQDKGTINLYFFDLDIAIVVSLAWWNAPYQKGGKVE